jgi:phage tail sheath protein FI
LRLGGGVNSADLTNSQITTGFDLFDDAETIEVDFLIPPQSSTDSDAVTIANYLNGIAKDRKDCVVPVSPHRNGIVGVSTATANTNAISFANDLSNSSYLIVDNNYLKVFDKYNDQYIYIPANSSTAGIMAATDYVAAPWFSPAGQRRGNYLSITDIAHSPNKTQRDALYKANVNPIANIPGVGIVLYGDKTHELRPSAFDRINVRRLFIGIEKSIAQAAKNILFEFNDEFTRAEFVNVVEPLLREIQGRRGITDFKVVCDETNNTPAVVDRNEFVASMFIKPARSINFVTLNFVAVRTGVDFEEVVGTV